MTSDKQYTPERSNSLSQAHRVHLFLYALISCTTVLPVYDIPVTSSSPWHFPYAHMSNNNKDYQGVDLELGKHHFKCLPACFWQLVEKYNFTVAILEGNSGVNKSCSQGWQSQFGIEQRMHIGMLHDIHIDCLWEVDQVSVTLPIKNGVPPAHTLYS